MIDISKYCTEFGIDKDKLNEMFRKITNDNGGWFKVVSPEYVKVQNEKAKKYQKMEKELDAIRRKYASA